MLSFFPRGVLDEILNLIESVSEGFPSYSFIILLCLMYAFSLSSTNTSFILQAIILKLNPMYLMFPTAIATSFAFMLPVATPPNAVVFSYGYVKVIDMVRHLIFLRIHMCNLLNCEYFLYPCFEKVGGKLVYICSWFRPSFRPSFRNSVTLFRQRYLHNRLR